MCSLNFAAIQQAIKNPAYCGVLNQNFSEIVLFVSAQLRSIAPGIGWLIKYLFGTGIRILRFHHY